MIDKTPHYQTKASTPAFGPGRTSAIDCAASGASRARVDTAHCACRVRQDTLLCEWCKTLSREGSPSIAWVSLEDKDNSLNLFLRYLIAALQIHFPSAFEELLAMLMSAEKRPVEIPAPRL